MVSLSLRRIHIALIIAHVIPVIFIKSRNKNAFNQPDVYALMFAVSVGDLAAPSGGVSPTPLPQPTPRQGSSLLVDEYDDYVDSVESDDGNIDLLQQSSRVSGEQGKTKRAHHSRPPLGPPPQPAMARTLLDPIQLTNRSSTPSAADAAAGVASSSSSSTMQIQFRSLVQYRISAYVTWPDKPQMAASCSDGAPTNAANVAGYIFRYKALDDDRTTSGSSSLNEFIVRNLAANFVLLENLMPRVRYMYQVRYVFDRGEPSAWSQEALLDTTYNPTRT